MKADLHMHSTFSDGTRTTEELFQIAKENQVDLISITDHDICTSIDVNRRLSKHYGVAYIPGIELSTLMNHKPVHILGYFTDDSYQSKSMMEYYVFIRNSRLNRVNKFIENLKKYFDIEITYDQVISYSNGIVARPHIAKAIQANYPQYSFDTIFEEFIGDNSVAFVPSSKLSVQEGIDLLRKNHCVIVLAHPTLLHPSIKETVLNFQYDGLEAIYFRNKPGEEEAFRNLAQARNMIITGGSDYHGIKNDTKHGDIGETGIAGLDYEAYITFYENKVKK